MSEPARIADELLAEPPLLCAAILVALHDDPTLKVLPEDRPAMVQLRNKGCITGDVITSLGNQVAMVLRTRGIQPFPRA